MDKVNGNRNDVNVKENEKRNEDEKNEALENVSRLNNITNWLKNTLMTRFERK